MKYFFATWLILVVASHAAGLKFEKELVEVHVDLSAKSITKDFKFTNTSSERVKIRDADAGCSCVSVEVSEGKLSYAPGESGILRATFEIGSFQGAVDKTIHVWLEGDPDETPSSKATFRIHIPVIITLDPKTLKWEVGAKAETKTIAVIMNYEKPIHVISVSTSNANFSTELVTIEEGKKYEIKVTPTSTESPGLSIIRIETDVDVERQKVQQGFAVVRAPLPKS
jgi:hypothetical protein